MKLTSLSVADFKQIQKLLARKEKLAAQISKVDRMLEQYESGPAPKAQHKRKGAAKAGVRRRGSPRGQLKKKIVTALKASGAAGLHVKEVAAKVKRKEGNVRTWFFTTGKDMKNIKRVGPAKYRWQD